MVRFMRWELLIGLLLVLLMHGAALYGLWNYRLLPAPEEALTLFVNLINPPPVEKKLEPPLPPPPPKKVKLVKKVQITAPPQPILVSNAPLVSPAEPVAPPPSPVRVPESVVEAPPGPPQPVAAAPESAPGPVILSSDLAVACPQRTPPEYPTLSRRLKEQGRVVLRVELDEGGSIAAARVLESSGFKRLDDAGLAAVKKWHCNPATRRGEPVRAVALQPFDFILESH